MHNQDMNRIKEIRKERGLQQVEIAAEFGVSQDTVRYWERVGPPRHRIPAIARFLGVSPAYLMRWDEVAA